MHQLCIRNKEAPVDGLMLFTHALMEAHFNNHNFDENYKEIDVYSDILEHVSLLMI